MVHVDHKKNNSITYRESDPLQDSKEGTFKSIKESVTLATGKDREKPVLDWYMAMTDSIIAAIKSANACTPEEERKLAKVKDKLHYWILYVVIIAFLV